jgi:hypothetical protein
MNDHSFLRFLPILGEKIGGFLNNQSDDPILQKLVGSSLSKCRHFFGENVLKIDTSAPGHAGWLLFLCGTKCNWFFIGTSLECP